jgi:hypothetical protein
LVVRWDSVRHTGSLVAEIQAGWELAHWP